MKKILLLALALVLVGCGSDIPTTTDESSEGQWISIPAREQKWNAWLPNAWRVVPMPTSADAIFFASSGHQNLVVLVRDDWSEDVVARLAAKLDDGFLQVEETARYADEIQFSAKIRVTDPLRNFVQRAVAIPDSSRYVLLSCSGEVVAGGAPDCETIVRAFQISLDKTK